MQNEKQRRRSYVYIIIIIVNIIRLTGKALLIHVKCVYPVCEEKTPLFCFLLRRDLCNIIVVLLVVFVIGGGGWRRQEVKGYATSCGGGVGSGISRIFPEAISFYFFFTRVFRTYHGNPTLKREVSDVFGRDASSRRRCGVGSDVQV